MDDYVLQWMQKKQVSCSKKAMRGQSLGDAEKGDTWHLNFLKTITTIYLL